MNNSKVLNQYYVFFILSSVGNACADWAIFFFALERFGLGSTYDSSSSVSFYFIGMGLGRMIFAPFLGVAFDRFSKRHLSLAVDGIYASLLGLAALLFYWNELGPTAILFITTAISTFSQLHVQSVGFAAVKEQTLRSMSGDRSLNSGARMLATSFALSNSFGIAISGIAFEFLGFMGCMFIGVVSFIPIMMTYIRLFRNQPIVKKTTAYSTDLTSGLRYLLHDRTLLSFCLILSLYNVVGALFPAYLKMAVNIEYPNNGHVASVLLAIGLIFGIFFYKSFEKNCVNYRGMTVFPISFVPVLAGLAVAYLQPNVWTLGVVYFAACWGSGLRNVTTAIIRAKRIPNELVGRVNTLYGAMLNLGPILGGLFIVPVLQNDVGSGILSAIGVVVIATLLAFVTLSRERIYDIAKEVPCSN